MDNLLTSIRENNLFRKIIISKESLFFTMPLNDLIFIKSYQKLTNVKK